MKGAGSNLSKGGPLRSTKRSEERLFSRSPLRVLLSVSLPSSAASELSAVGSLSPAAVPAAVVVSVVPKLASAEELASYCSSDSFVFDFFVNPKFASRFPCFLLDMTAKHVTRNCPGPAALRCLILSDV